MNNLNKTKRKIIDVNELNSEDNNYKETINLIKNKILITIKNDIDKITDGYTIINSYSDGCDEYGFLYWVECKNGFNLRDHDIKSYLIKDIFTYLQNIIKNIRVELNDSIYQCELHENLIFEYIINLDHSDYNIIILNKEQIKSRNILKNKIEHIKDKFLKGLDVYYKDKRKDYNYYRINFNFTKNIDCMNIKNFKDSLSILFNYNDFIYRKIINKNSNNLIKKILKNSNLTEEEINLLNLN